MAELKKDGIRAAMSEGVERETLKGMGQRATNPQETLELCPLAHPVKEGVKLWSSSAGQKWHIWCYDCGLEFEGQLNQPKDEVIKAWNTRVRDSAAATVSETSSDAWREWFGRLGAIATADVVNATATLVIKEKEIAAASPVALRDEAAARYE